MESKDSNLAYYKQAKPVNTDKVLILAIFDLYKPALHVAPFWQIEEFY